MSEPDVPEPFTENVLFTEIELSAFNEAVITAVPGPFIVTIPSSLTCAAEGLLLS